MIGRSILLNGAPYEVVGVMPADFSFLLKTDVWTTLGLTAAAASDRNNKYLQWILQRDVVYGQPANARDRHSDGLGRASRQRIEFGGEAGNEACRRRCDCRLREIPNTVETHSLMESHKSKGFDHSGIQANHNLVFPLDRFRELVARGEVGELNYRHFSFMGSIIGPRKLIEETALRVARLLRDDGVDAVFLTPA
jgi:hypothetical protein